MKRLSVSSALSTLLVTCALVSQQAYQVNANKCYAVAFSSGQESSAFQAGALLGLLQKVQGDQMQYSSISGIAGGAINAVYLASHAKGDEQAAANQMKQFWTDAGNTKLYQDWFGGIVNGLLLQGGLYDNSPLKAFIQKEFANTNIHRDIAIGIVDALKGSYQEFSEANITSGDNLINSLYSSFSIPGFFPPVKAFGSKWFDGSAVYELDISSAINRCLEQTSEENVVVDVLMTSSANLKQVDGNDYRSIGMLFRFLEINSFYHSMDGLLRAKFAYPKINFRYVISPTKSLPTSLYPLSLSAQQIQDVINQGISDASAAVHAGEGVSIENMIQYYYMKKTNDSRLSKMTLGDFLEAKTSGQFDEPLDTENDHFFLRYK